MSLFNRSTFGVIARSDLGIKTMKDLEGKCLAVTAGDGLTQLWPAVVAANKLDGDKIRLVMMDATAKTTSFLDKQVVAVLGGITEFPPLFKAKGVDSVVLAFADYGLLHQRVPDELVGQPEGGAGRQADGRLGADLGKRLPGVERHVDGEPCVSDPNTVADGGAEELAIENDAGQG